jgi:hypothetical protein
MTVLVIAAVVILVLLCCHDSKPLRMTGVAGLLVVVAFVIYDIAKNGVSAEAPVEDCSSGPCIEQPPTPDPGMAR